MPGRDPCQMLRELLTTMQNLRAPGGCPWDAEQTPESLAPYILEEACETIEAIETGSPEMIVDELGDLLLQVVFQAEIFAERGQFDFADVAAAITAKLMRRHPHVFASGDKARSDDELARQWESIKRAEQAGHPQLPSHPLGQLPGNLPALQRAQKLISRARRAGMDLQHCLAPSSPHITVDAETVGRNLLALVNQAELSGVDAEQALRRTVQKVLAETLRKPAKTAAEN